MDAGDGDLCLTRIFLSNNILKATEELSRDLNIMLKEILNNYSLYLILQWLKSKYALKQ